METHYQKAHYDDLPGFTVHHTVGPDAANSTIQHLHLNESRMILYFIHGSGNIIVENKTHHIGPGDIVITDARELFHCTIDPNTYHERLSVHIDPHFWSQFPWDTGPLFRVFSDCKKGIGNLIPAEAAARGGLTDAFWQLLSSAQQTRPTRDAAAVGNLIHLLTLLDEAAGTFQRSHDSSLSSPLIYRILQYLNDHFTQNINVEAVAAQFHISPSYLAHLFKKQTGISLWNYVILQRLHLANTLLRNNMSTEEACYAVGFDNYANFYRLYKKHTGIPPSQYKKQMQFHQKDAILNKTT